MGAQQLLIDSNNPLLHLPQNLVDFGGGRVGVGLIATIRAVFVTALQIRSLSVEVGSTLLAGFAASIGAQGWAPNRKQQP
jgi:hypothetical protein